MTLPTTISIKYTCGHIEATDLSTIPAGRRKAHAYGLAKNKICTKCFNKRNAAGRREWLDSRNSQTLADAEVFEETHGLNPVEGSDKQLSWGTRTRFELLSVAQAAPEISETAFSQRILPAARKILKAGWWITNADTEPIDIEELVTTATPEDHVDTENPF